MKMKRDLQYMNQLFGPTTIIWSIRESKKPRCKYLDMGFINGIKVFKDRCNDKLHLWKIGVRSCYDNKLIYEKLTNLNTKYFCNSVEAVDAAYKDPNCVMLHYSRIYGLYNSKNEVKNIRVKDIKHTYNGVLYLVEYDDGTEETLDNTDVARKIAYFKI